MMYQENVQTEGKLTSEFCMHLIPRLCKGIGEATDDYS
jgi:hypothetical protein